VPPTGTKAGSVWGEERVFEVAAKGCLDCELTMAAGAGEFVIAGTTTTVGSDVLGVPPSAVALTEGTVVSVAGEASVPGKVGALF
jgi:hypothetical protein